MLDGLPAELVARIGLGGLLGLAVLLVLTGRLVPRSAVEDRIRDKVDQIADLRTTLAVREEHIRVRDQQLDKLLTNSDLTVQLLQSIRVEAGSRGDLEA